MNNNNPLPAAAADLTRRQQTIAWSTLCALLAGFAALPASHAQVMRIEPAIGAEVTYSNNGNQAPSGQQQPDVAIDLRPEFWVTYQTARLRARGVLGATATTYIGGSREGSIYPSIDLAATYQAIRDFFYVDADVVAQRQYASPFAPRSTSGDQNAYASYAYRVAPYFQGTLPSVRMSYLLRNDFLWTRTNGTLGNQFDDGFEWRIRGELATEGDRPLGITYQYQRDYLKFANQPEFIVEVGRAIGTYRVNPDLSVNVRAGYEWEIFPLSEGQGAIYGAGFAWLPTPRTNVTAWWEERFFGPSWLANISHRMPWFAVAASSSRLLSTGSQSLFNVPRTNDVFRSLDAILTTRVPDPIDRANAVRDLLLLTGLPPTLGVPIPINSQRIDLHETHSVSAGFLGARNSLVFDAYYLDREGITATGDPLPAPFQIFTDEVQRGASVTFSHRMARSDSVNATALWQKTEGSTVFNSSAESTQWTGRLQYNKRLQARTTGFAGVRYIVFRSNVFPDFNEANAFVGLYHRF